MNNTKHTHWTFLLPESGTIKVKGEQIIAMRNKREMLLVQIAALNAEIDRAENDAVSEALAGWSKEEINEAINKAKGEA